MIAQFSRSFALVAATILMALFGGLLTATAAHAAQMPSGPFTIAVHKTEMPGPEPVQGATFTATRVPGIDVTTNAGQQQAASLTLEAAAALIAPGTPAEATGITDALGNATLGGLPQAGLYYVQETATPAGSVASAPFIVTLPLTDSATRDGWLTTVHIYPKNERAHIALEVFDADAVVLGDIVAWKSTSNIPGLHPGQGYAVQHVLPDQVLLSGTLADVRVGLTGASAPALQAGTHYVISDLEIDGRRAFQVSFTAAGLVVLEAAAASNPEAQVTIDYDTTVTSRGELTVETRLLIGGPVAGASSSSASGGGSTVAAAAHGLRGPLIAADPPAPVARATATTKWGPLGITVHLKGDPSHRIAGAKFELFLSAEDAAAGVNPIALVDGTKEWTSNAQGEVLIRGLRFSSFVNGRNVPLSDPLHRWYYVKLVEIPPGYSGTLGVQRLEVSDPVTARFAVFDLQQGTSPGPAPGGGDLALTGGQLAGVGIIALMLAGAGVMTLVRRRRRDADAVESS